MKYEYALCPNCNYMHDVEDLVHANDPFSIPKLSERLESGDVIPCGECPDCGALCTPEAKRTYRVAVTGVARVIQYVELKAFTPELAREHALDKAHETGKWTVEDAVQQECTARPVEVKSE